jgi:hypothetical protein
MSEHEERLERAMHEHASAVTPVPDWEDVERRAAKLRSRRLRVRAGIASVGLAAAVLLIVGVVSALDDGGGELQVAVTTPDTTTTSTEPATTTTAAPVTTTTPTTVPPTTVPVPVRPAGAIFPFAGERQFQDAGAAAVAFGRDYLGMPDPVVHATNLSARTVDIRYRSDRPTVTTVLVEESGGAWYVTGARTANIDLVTPEPGDRISSPVTVTGQSTAFEAQVNWEIRQDGQGFGQKLGEGFFMGGSMGEFRPFEAPLSFNRPGRAAGAIVLLTFSPEDGAVTEATVVRVTFG